MTLERDLQSFEDRMAAYADELEGVRHAALTAKGALSGLAEKLRDAEGDLGVARACARRLDGVPAAGCRAARSKARRLGRRRAWLRLQIALIRRVGDLFRARGRRKGAAARRRRRD